MSDELLQLMTRAQPVRDEDLQKAAGPELTAFASRVVSAGRAAEKTGAQGQRVGRRRRNRLAKVGVVGAAFFAVLAGPAAAEWVSLHTGDTDSMSHTEMWRMDSPETPAALIKLTKDYPLAPGYTTKSMIAANKQTNAQMPELGFRQVVSSWSRCSWEQTWLAAKKTSDTRTEATASRFLVSFPERTQHPVELYRDADTLSQNTIDLARAVEDDQTALVANDVAVNCDPEVVK